MGRDDWYDANASFKSRSRHNKRRGGRGRLVALMVVIILSFGICGGAFVMAQTGGTEDPGTVDVVATPTVTTAAEATPTGTQGEGSGTPAPTVSAEVTPEVTMAAAAGPFGILEASPTPTPAIDIPAGEEIWMADFVDTRVPVVAKGIYVTADVAKNSAIDALIELLDTTELNALVIDIKADNGTIVYEMDSKTAKQIGATTNIIYNLPALMTKLKEHNIYTIARVVAFKDPILASERPDLCFKFKDGSKFYDGSGVAWVSAYKKDVWDYLVEVGIACAEVGFNEINFDYLRFPTDGVSNIDWGEESKTTTKTEAITAFVKYICEQLRPHGIYVSGDVYATVINSKVDADDVGQDYVSMARYLDYIYPMVYPSHYGNGYAGVEYPDLEPYKIISLALQASVKKLATIPSYQHVATVRPWLQDFTASYLKHHMEYDAAAVKDEIKAVYDTGYSEWFLWNAGVSYTEDALLPE